MSNISVEPKVQAYCNTSDSGNMWLRLQNNCWLFIFFFSLRFSYGRGNSLKDPASKAYAQVFAAHHGWAIRKAVAAGMYALPTRAQLLRKLNEDGERYPMTCLFLLSNAILLFTFCFYFPFLLNNYKLKNFHIFFWRENENRYS